jgi:hypothetical protein
MKMKVKMIAIVQLTTISLAISKKRSRKKKMMCQTLRTMLMVNSLTRTTINNS